MAESPEEKPKRARRRRKDSASEDAAASEALSASGSESGASASGASASDADATPESAVDEVEPTAEDAEAADSASDVLLEAEDEVDADTDAEVGAETTSAGEEPPAKASRRPRRRRTGEEVAKPAPTRRRRPARDPNLPPPVVRAQAKYVRSSARKARLVCDHIRGKTVGEARAILAHTPRAVARDWSKLLESAIANAENNHELVGEDLYIKAVHADEGPTIKRFRPRAQGRATRIRKRTSHLTILLTPKE